MNKISITSISIFKRDIKVKNSIFLIISTLLFPAILLIIATLQPKVFFNKESIFYSLSFSVLYIHILLFILLTFFFINRIGQLPFADLGLNKKDFLKALWLIPVVWFSEQILLLILSFTTNTEIKLNDIWLNQNSIIKAISSFLANTVATGLNEETFFRGFLFVQFFHHFENFFNNKKLKAFFLAAFLSSVIFSLCHLQFSISALAFLMVGGLVGATIYYLTNNLFYGIILHGFFNSPLPIFECSDSYAKLTILLIIAIVVIIDVIKKRTHNTGNRCTTPHFAKKR
jgi:membrane protease YdiL (CAAX protease family)